MYACLIFDGWIEVDLREQNNDLQAVAAVAVVVDGGIYVVLFES